MAEPTTDVKTQKQTTLLEALRLIASRNLSITECHRMAEYAIPEATELLEACKTAGEALGAIRQMTELGAHLTQENAAQIGRDLIGICAAIAKAEGVSNEKG